MHHVAVVTPPSEVVSLVEAKAHLRVDHADEDILIEALVAAATARLDGPGGILNRALSTQVLRATIDGFPAEPLALRYEPIQSVDLVQYTDPDGDTLTVGASVYELTADGRLQLAYGQAWPSVRDPAEPVTIRYTAGYADLPKPLRAAILLMVGDLYAYRESIVTGTIAAELPISVTVDRLISPYRNLRA